ncbi:MAG TPA: hypothetical protein VLZ05_09885 [Mycobacterium sp.]|nr:hypothetical protein [Mycobacterium sp.]HUH69150.1 hypothetical protein [Mycobacterium sp.]
MEQQWNAQKTAIADLVEQQRNSQIAERWDAQRKAFADLVEQQWDAQRGRRSRIWWNSSGTQKKAIEEALNAIGGMFKRKPE